MFAQPRNLSRPAFWRMLRDIRRFCREAPRLLKAADEGLELAGRPRLRTVTGGSRRYVEKLTAPFAAAVRTGCLVMRVERNGAAVFISTATGGIARWPARAGPGLWLGSFALYAARRHPATSIVAVFNSRDQATRWWVRRRVFFLACAEWFVFGGGAEWFVGHYLLEKRKTGSGSGPQRQAGIRT